jgi:hypothetical protein
MTRGAFKTGSAIDRPAHDALHAIERGAVQGLLAVGAARGSGLGEPAQCQATIVRDPREFMRDA